MYCPVHDLSLIDAQQTFITEEEEDKDVEVEELEEKEESDLSVLES